MIKLQKLANLFVDFNERSGKRTRVRLLRHAHFVASNFIHFLKFYKTPIMFGVLMVPSFALAQKLANPAPGAGATLEDFVYLIIEIIQWVAIPVLALCIIYAGFILVSAGGNEEQVTKGKTWIVWTLAGAAIIIGASVIADIVFGTANLFQ